jgi:hypothetical protein
VIAIATAIAITLVTLPVVGLDAWLDFLRALLGATPDCSGFNVSVACLVGPSVGLGVGSLLGVIVGVAAACALAVVREPFWMAVLSAVAVMAPANNLHIHYWTIAYVIAIAGITKIRTWRSSSSVSPAPLPI